MEYLSLIAGDLSFLSYGVVSAAGLVLAWWLLCRFVFLRKAEATWRAHILNADLTEQLYLYKQGSPVDRFFLGGLAISGVVLMCYLVTNWPMWL